MAARTFRRVASMADDAITVRIRYNDGEIVGILDFPPFLTNEGTFLRASSLPVYSVPGALQRALTLQPMTPFPEIVVFLDPSVAWQPEWGGLEEKDTSTSGQAPESLEDA